MNKVVLFTVCAIWYVASPKQIPSTAANIQITDANQTQDQHLQSKHPFKVLLLTHLNADQVVNDQQKRLEQSASITTWCVNRTDGNRFLCPRTSVCTSDYNFCPYATTNCNSTRPFRCGNGTCVSNPALQCCPPINNVTRVWCPHLNTCVNATNATQSCCSLNSSTPFYCSATKSCVARQFDCCSQNQLAKCSFENKCAQANTRDYCFQPYNRSCSGEFAYQCPNDGTCKRSAADCSSSRVCPPGYTTCPDYSCLAGLNQIAMCPKLPTCIIKGVTLARCSDGVTCTDNLDKCPTQVTCPQGQVVCPDNSCVDSEAKCVQPPQTSPPKGLTCAKNMLRCPDGECASNCQDRIPTYNCASQGLVQCPRTFQCANSYDSCASDTYCPIPQNYTLSTSAVICSEGPNICTWEASQCKRQSCFNPLFYFKPSNSLIQPWQSYNPLLLKSCPDGRCNPSTSSCMTEVSCSSQYVKGQTTGPYCHNSTTEVDLTAQLALQLNALTCPSNMITCLSGHCRENVYDCPQLTTCPTSSPIQCQDGQCVTSKQSCNTTDQLVSVSMRRCQDQNKLLCQSDLLSCVTSIELCPTMSTCPMGYNKCSENQCLFGVECPAQPSTCSSSTPFYCRSTGTCIQNQTMCLSLTTCPPDKPVKCGSDQSCQQSISKCPKVSNLIATVPTVQTQITSVVLTTSCGSNSLYRCQDRQCRAQCPEWSKCPLSTDFQCPDGLCVTNQTQCANTTNGCPFYTPFRCNYTAKCVSNLSQCANQTTSNTTLKNACTQQFGSSVKQCVTGNCIQTNATCQNSSETCKRYLYPNMNFQGSCFVPQCPPSLPYKCENGLCVSDAKFCPVVAFIPAQINKCQSLSKFTGQALPVPCGDGSCVARSELCPPLYDCLLNFNLTTSTNFNYTVRCNDGTCQSSKMECAQLDQSCTHRCSNGMCVGSAGECLLDNGCAASTPYKCEQNGQCMLDSQSCTGNFEINQAFSFSASKSTSICYKQQKVSCISGELEYCASNRANCINVDSGCNVFTPVLCNGKCVQSVLKCTTGLTPTLNNRACSQSNPFRCQNTEINSCAALPFSLNQNMYQSVCSAKTQSLIGLYPINRCTSQLKPISCSDGSCVTNLGECRTCNFFCSSMMQCTRNAAECQVYTSGKATTFRNLDQKCPEGVPIRCILNGRCVSQLIDCDETPQVSQAQTFRSNLLDLTCPTDSPLRCISGNCVNSSVFCFNQTLMSAAQMIQPILWNGSLSQSTQACQVYCADGSCRDSQQNCPLAQACSSPEAPYRCRSGVCTSNQLQCVSIYGNSELEPDQPYSAYCYQLFGQNSSQQFFRCEDGTCRPAKFDNITKTYSSSCLTFLGCPLAAAYQCPTGQCVKIQTECLKYSHPFCKGKYMCKNLMCVTDPSYCSQDQSQFRLIPHTVDINPLLSNELQFLVADKQIVGNLSLPSSSLSLLASNYTLAQSVYQRVSFQVVPNQRSMNSSVLSSSVSYTQSLYTVTNNTLSLEDSLLFPLFEMKLLDTNQTIFNYEATLSIQLNLPTSFDLASDVCLAMQSLNGSFDCVTRNIKKVETTYSMPIKSAGIYAVIFSPDVSLKGSQPNPPTPFPTPNPNPNPDQTDQCSWYCQNKKLAMWLIIGAGILVFIILVIIVWCICRNRRSAANQQQDTKKNPLIPNRRPTDAKNTQKYEKTNPTETQVTEDNTNKKITLNDSSSDDQDDKGGNSQQERMRKQIEKKLKAQVEQQLLRERSEFQQVLQVKEQEIRALQSNIKETEERQKSSSPDSRPTYSSVQKREKKLEKQKRLEAQMREHFQNEVNRISKELIQQAEEAKSGPPRKFQRSSKESSIKSFNTNSNYGSMPAGNAAPTLNNMMSSESHSELNEQWNDLMDEYASKQGNKALVTNEEVLKPRSKNNKGFQSQQTGEEQKPTRTLTETTGYTKRASQVGTKSPTRRQR